MVIHVTEFRLFRVMSSRRLSFCCSHLRRCTVQRNNRNEWAERAAKCVLLLIYTYWSSVTY